MDPFELKELQRIWYQKLRESGFEDIEDTKRPQEFLKTWHSRYFFSRYTPEEYEEKIAYYSMASEFYWKYAGFKNEQEKEIWRLHCEGFSRRKIAEQIKPKMSDSSVQIILAHLKQVMQTRAWPSISEVGELIVQKFVEEKSDLLSRFSS